MVGTVAGRIWSHRLGSDSKPRVLGEVGVEGDVAEGVADVDYACVRKTDASVGCGVVCERHVGQVLHAKSFRPEELVLWYQVADQPVPPVLLWCGSYFETPFELAAGDLSDAIVLDGVRIASGSP